MRAVVVLAVSVVLLVGCSSEKGVTGYLSSASITAKEHVADELGVNPESLRVTMVPEVDGDCVVTVVEHTWVVFMHWEGKHQFRVTDWGEDMSPSWLTEDNPGCYYAR